MFPRASGSLGNEIPAHDDLVSGNIRTQPFELAAGTYVRGEVVEWDGDNDAMKKLATAAKANAVVVEGVTLTANTTAPLYVGGDFNEDALVIGDADLDDVKLALSNRGIVARKWGAAPDSA